MKNENTNIHEKGAINDLQNKSIGNSINYVNKAGNITFIVGISYTGEKAFADVLEEFILSAFQKKHMSNYQ